jgi:hypothetical protein
MLVRRIKQAAAIFYAGPRHIGRSFAKVALVFALALLPASAFGQSTYYQPSIYPFGQYYQPVQPWPLEMGLSIHHFSTAPGDIIRAQANWLQSLGVYRINSMQAMILAEQARWARMANDWQRTLYYQARNELRAKQLEAIRLDNLSRRLAKYRVAYELTPEELNTLTGTIVWPEVLLAGQYDESRMRLEALLRSYFGYSPSERAAAEIAREAQKLTRALRNARVQLARDEYLAAQQFLRGIEFAPEFAAPTAIVASVI